MFTFTFVLWFFDVIIPDVGRFWAITLVVGGGAILLRLWIVL